MRYRQFCYFNSVLILPFLSTLGIARANPDNSTKYKLCTSQICNNIGNEIIKSIDRSINPCIDFYKHACGRWLANHRVSNAQGQVNQQLFLRLFTLDRLTEILQKNDMPGSSALRKVQQYYNSCTNLTAIEAAGLAPLKSLVLANGGWPLILPPNSWNLEDNYLMLQKILENYGKVVGHSLFSIEIYPIVYGTEFHDVLMLFQKPVVTTGYLSKQSHLTYAMYVRKMTQEFAASTKFNASTPKASRDLASMIQFEMSLIGLYSRHYIHDPKTDSIGVDIIPIDILQSRWDRAVSGHPKYAIDWLKMLRNALNGTSNAINNTTMIYCRKSMIEKLADLLKKNDLYTVVNYVHWHAISHLALDTNTKMRQITNEFYTKMSIPQVHDIDRPRYCANRHTMLHGVFYAYVRKYFGKNISRPVYDMVRQIQAEMKQQFTQSTWLDPTEKYRFQKKVSEMLIYIGYPHWYDEQIDKYYSELTIGPNYFDNLVNTKIFNVKKSLQKLQERHYRNFTEWKLEPLTLDMMYSAHLNYVMLPAMFFQMPAFHTERPLAMNYGSMGAMIAHELAHAFDINGIRYNEYGLKEQWCSNSTIARYTKSTQCFVDQYSNYTLIEYANKTIIKIDGDKTLNENIADNVGSMVALRAYFSYKKNKKFNDIRIPILKDYTDEQLYFYSLSNFWCGAQESDAELKNDIYSPRAFRINGVVSNMREFSEAFSCPSGYPMNPKKKCVLWD